MASDLLVVFWNGALFSGTWLLLAPSGPWHEWMAIYSGLAFASSGFGYLAGSLLKPASAAMVMTIGSLTFAVFSGIQPPLAHVQRYPVVDWAWALSFGTWVANAVYITYTRYWRGERDVAAGGAAYGFDVSDAAFTTAIGALFGIGCMWRALAVWACVARADGSIWPAPLRAAAARCLRSQRAAS
jgi:hypothetical protein